MKYPICLLLLVCIFSCKKVEKDTSAQPTVTNTTNDTVKPKVPNPVITKSIRFYGHTSGDSYTPARISVTYYNDSTVSFSNYTGIDSPYVKEYFTGAFKRNAIDSYYYAEPKMYKKFRIKRDSIFIEAHETFGGDMVFYAFKGERFY